MSNWTPDSSLARIRIRQWWRERTALRNGRTKDYTAPGRPNKHATTNRFDAGIVRCIDFEMALGQLTGEQQTMLLMAYRDGEGHRAIAQVAGCTERVVAYRLPIALKLLAEVLDQRNLL